MDGCCFGCVGRRMEMGMGMEGMGWDGMGYKLCMSDRQVRS